MSKGQKCPLRKPVIQNIEKVIGLQNKQCQAKVIDLIAELRTDLSTVKNCYDQEADTIQQSTDPQMVLNILQDNLKQQPKVNLSVVDPKEKDVALEK